MAINGYEGYNKILEKEYDLVICDLNMPVMDGFTFCLKTTSYYQNKNQLFEIEKANKPYLVACSAMVN